MFFSKLLSLIVHSYQQEGNQGLYIWPRAICLYIYIYMFNLKSCREQLVVMEGGLFCSRWARPAGQDFTGFMVVGAPI